MNGEIKFMAKKLTTVTIENPNTLYSSMKPNYADKNLVHSDFNPLLFTGIFRYIEYKCIFKMKFKKSKLNNMKGLISFHK